MAELDVKTLLKAGVHFGHLTRKRHPNMTPYIFMEKNGTHILDLNQTVNKLDESLKALGKIAKTGRRILFVATKKQAQDILVKHIKPLKMPYITERWPGGLLTNFVTIRKAVKKMATIDKMKEDGTISTLSKRERLQLDRKRQKLEKYLGSISEMNRIPGAVFIVDIVKEKIALLEARKLGIPTFAMVDTNSDPNLVDFPIPANDDASRSIDIILSSVASTVAEAVNERLIEKKSKSKESNNNQKDVDKDTSK